MSSRPIPDDARDAVRRDPVEPAQPRRAAAGSLRPVWPGSPGRAAAMLLLGSLPFCFLCGLLVDEPVARAAMQAPAGLHGAARIFSDLGLSGYMLILSALLAASSFVALRRERFAPHGPVLSLMAERALFVFACVAVSGLMVQIIKHLVGRARPKLIDQFGPFHFDLFSIKASLASFPSGHATSIFALAAAIGFIAPRLRPAMFVLAVLVALARVVLAAHYASDILAGAALGLATTLAMTGVFAGRGVGFTLVGGLPRLKGRGTIWSALRAEADAMRTRA